MLLHKMYFKVNGVTFNNENNISIQDEIVKILKEYKKNGYFDKFYCDYTKKEIIEMNLNVSEYEGYYFNGYIKEDLFDSKKCYKVYIECYDNSFFHIGYVPKEYINELSEWIDKKELKYNINITITGGKCKHCVYKTVDYEEIEDVEIVELNYGFNIDIQFFDDKVNVIQKNIEEKRGLFNKFFKNKNG
ncbi:MAG: hypothetical protein IJV31_11400 [Clostridia bacterium]|nr:hypothetical protein [Clostridia bacterium]